MPSDMCKLRRCLMAGAAGAALALAAGLGGAGPALAADDGGPFSSVLNLFGAPTNKPDETINYQPRPPLVVPPKTDLPQPQAKAAHGADWPNDPDVAARHRAAADSRRPAPQVNLAPPPGSPESVLVRMKDECGVGNKTCIAPEDSFWDKIKDTFSGGVKEVVLNGAEPNRDYLVDPPPGYRRPLAVPEKAAPPPQQQKEAQSIASTTTAQPPDANLKPAETSATQAPAPQAPAPQKEHFGLW
ncbi:MAG: hypothetical protein ACLPID_02140 [Beijerinckiaceae bacterium]